MVNLIELSLRIVSTYLLNTFLFYKSDEVQVQTEVHLRYS